MADQDEYSTPIPQGATLGSPVDSQNQSSGTDEYSTPIPQGATLGSPQSFTTPNGTTLTPGQTVTHSSGMTGTVTGQQPDTGKAIVQWNQNHPGQQYGVEGTMRANDPQNMGTAVARWAEQVANDVKYGTDFTGIGKVLKKMGAHGVDVGNSEAVGNWMASIPLGLLRTGKGLAEAAGSQSAGGNWQAVKDMVGGVGQTAEMPTAVIAPESSELEDLAGQAVDHAGELASKATSAAGDAARAGVNAGKNVASKAVVPVGKAARKVYPEAMPEQPIYDTLHEQLRGAITKAAQDVGIDVKPSESIQDVATDAAKAFKAQASKLYGQIDDAIESVTGQPGRYQAHDEAISALQDKLQNAIGDPAEQAKYAKAIQEEEAAKQASLNHIKNAGLEDLPKQATQLHKQSRALEDLGKKVQNSTSGLPASAGGSPERLNPKTFATSLRNLKNNTRYGASRLEQALGKDGANTIIKQTDEANQALQQSAEAAVKRAGVKDKLIKGAVTAATGATGAGIYDLVK